MRSGLKTGHQYMCCHQRATGAGPLGQALAKGPGVDSWFWVLATQLHKDPSQARLGIVELVTQPVSVSLSVMWGEDGIYPSGPPEVL